MEQQFILSPWLCYAIGLLGILTHVMVKALKLGRTLGVVLVYLSANSLPIVITVLMYTGLVFYWLVEGVSMFGMVKGQLTAMTFMLGYLANSIFRELVEKRVNKNLQEKGIGT